MAIKIYIGHMIYWHVVVSVQRANKLCAHHSEAVGLLFKGERKKNLI